MKILSVLKKCSSVKICKKILLWIFCHALRICRFGMAFQALWGAQRRPMRGNWSRKPKKTMDGAKTLVYLYCWSKMKGHGEQKKQNTPRHEPNVPMYYFHAHSGKGTTVWLKITNHQKNDDQQITPKAPSNRNIKAPQYTCLDVVAQHLTPVTSSVWMTTGNATWLSTVSRVRKSKRKLSKHTFRQSVLR